MTQISHRLDPDAPFEAIKATLKANGICVLPNFLPSKKAVAKNKGGLLDGSTTRSARSILSALRNRLPG